MAALPAERLDGMNVAGSSLGWQDMRQQLFGQQRQRAVESRLARALGEVHQRIARATRGGMQSPKQRGKALAAVFEGANQLICWHRDEILAERAAGTWTEALPDTASELLCDLRAAYPTFEGAKVVNRVLDCADVVQAIAHLCGEEGDQFFNEAMAGATLLLAGVFDRIASDEPTAGAAAALGDVWDALLSDVEALALPVQARAADEAIILQLPAARVRADEREDLADAEDTPPLAVDGETADEVEAPLPEPLPLRVSRAAGVIGRLEAVVSPDTPAAVEARPLPVLAPILAARFSRIQLVAC